MQTEAKKFFDRELELLDELIHEAERLRAEDRKLQHFLDEVIETSHNDHLKGSPGRRP